MQGPDAQRNPSGKRSHWIEGADHENSSIHIIQQDARAGIVGGHSIKAGV